jgi:hypothetical protein
MPTIITSAVVIPQFSQHHGPFEIGANLYAAAYDNTGGTDRIRMYKSTDGGANWTEQDAANALTAYKATTYGQRFIDIQQDGSTLYVGFLEVGGAFNIAPFSGDLWGALITGGPTIGGVSNPRVTTISFVRRSAGEYMVFWITGTPDTRGALYSGGAWGSAFTVSTTATVVGACADSSARTWIFMAEPNGSMDNSIICRTYTSANVLSAADIPVATDLISLGFLVGLPVVYTPTGGLETVAIAYPRGIQYPGYVGFQTTTAHMAYAYSVAKDAPVFTNEEINYLNNPIGEGAFGEQDYVTCIKNGIPTVFWVSGVANIKYWDLVYNARGDSCSSNWETLNTWAFNLVEGTTPSNASGVEMIEGRYLSGRGKCGLLVYLNTVSPSDFAVYYMEI